MPASVIWFYPLTRSCDKEGESELNREEAWARSFLPEHRDAKISKGAAGYKGAALIEFYIYI